jgi:arylsulfatase A-like enzyme/Flp pilus assembly protein TadD
VRPGCTDGIRVVLRLAIVAALIAVAACSPARHGVRRVVLVSIDTLRADALGSYGNPRDTTPALDAIARDGTRATECIAPSPITLPSHATLLTGLHPLTHGVLANGYGALAADVETLAERLQHAGWSTGAVVASGILRARYGLAQGFDRYRDDLFATAPGVTSGRGIAEARADVVTDAALAWLTERAEEERVFLFLHLIDPHAPYDAPGAFGERFRDEPYLGEVAFADAQVGRLVDALDQRGWLDETLLVVTSDHGEHLGAHGLPTHGFYLYDEVLRIPLLLRGPGIAAGGVIDAPTTLADIVPTVLEATGLAADGELQGRSLLGKIAPDRRVLSVSYEGRLLHAWSPIWSWRSSREKLLRAPQPQLFRLDRDPGEQHDLAGEEPARTHELVAEVDALATRLRTAAHTAIGVALDDEARAQLEALGYAAPAAMAPIEDPLDFSRADPHAMRAAYDAIAAYLTARVTGDLDEAHELLDRAQALDPANPLLHEERGLLLVLQQRYGEVLEWYDGLDEPVRSGGPAALHRATALRRLGRTREAEATLRAAIERHPELGALSLELARLLSATGRLEESLAEYDALLAREPRHDVARYGRSELLVRMGRTDDAIAGLEELVRLAPDYAPAWRVLGLHSAAEGETEVALEQLERFIRLAPHSPHRRSVERVIVRLKLERES